MQNFCKIARKLSSKSIVMIQGIVNTNFPNMANILPNRIRQLALTTPNKLALRNEFNEEITYGQLYKAAKSVADALNHGKACESIAIMSKDPVQMAIGLFGVWMSSRTAVPLRNFLIQIYLINIS